MNRYKDWFQQAKRDLEHAKKSLKMEDYGWACFAAHQGAEKAVKSLFMKLGEIAWGHSVYELLKSLPENVKPNNSFIDKAKTLDRYYIPPRYPNAHPSGPSYQYYLEKDAKEAISIAQEVIEYCGSKGL